MIGSCSVQFSSIISAANTIAIILHARLRYSLYEFTGYVTRSRLQCEISRFVLPGMNLEVVRIKFHHF